MRLEDSYNLPEAQSKITQIALGIMHKNQPVVQKLDTISAQQISAINNRKELQDTHSTIIEHIRADRGRNIS